MGESKQLYNLQIIDKKLFEKKAALEHIVSQLGKCEELDSIRSDLSIKQQNLDALDKAQKSLEWDLQDIRDRTKEFEKQLYGGKTTNTKELLALQQEVEILKKKQKDKEDKTLDIMVDVEVSQAQFKTLSDKLKEAEREWQAEQDKLRIEQEELLQSIKSLEQDRLQSSTQISKSNLDLYEDVLARRGQAVVKVERGMCQGCRLILPVNEWQRVRLGDLVQCSSCNRILHLE